MSQWAGKNPVSEIPIRRTPNTGSIRPDHRLLFLLPDALGLWPQRSSGERCRCTRLSQRGERSREERGCCGGAKWVEPTRGQPIARQLRVERSIHVQFRFRSVRLCISRLNRSFRDRRRRGWKLLAPHHPLRRVDLRYREVDAQQRLRVCHQRNDLETRGRGGRHRACRSPPRSRAPTHPLVPTR